jgi:tetratricopeptide (TPR) repeat protein
MPRKPPPLPDSFDPLEIALDAERADSAADSPARTVLLKQSRLIDAQMRQLAMQLFSERVGVVLKVLTGVAGLAVAVLLGAMIYNAAHDRALVIEGFQAPPDLIARGLTGQVFAAQLMDRLAAIDTDAASFRAPRSFQGDWGGDIKVEIPETGVSIGELDRYLRGLLSHRTTIGGEVFRRPNGQITLNVRTGALGSHSFTGPEADLDAMLQKAAEAVFNDTQPFRYSKYLEKVGRLPEAMTVARRLAETGPATEKPWAWAQISNLLELSDMQGAADAARMSVRLDPNQGLGYLNLSIAETFLGHEEASLEASRRSVAILERGGGGLSDTGIQIGRANAARAPARLGDFRAAADISRRFLTFDVTYMNINRFQPTNYAMHLMDLHDLKAARAVPDVLGDAATAAMALAMGRDAAPQFHAAMEAGDWAGAEAFARTTLAVLRGQHSYVSDLVERVSVRPRLALAVARQGRAAEAAQLIADAPLDCYRCLIERGQIAALAGDRAGSDHWFSLAAAQAPHLPFAQLEWARALLAAGDADGALAQLRIAQARAPKFADVREVMGEALLAKGDARGALTQFTATDAITPRWGRNHLMWGLALARSGKTAEVQAQWKLAAGMDLIPPDRTAVQSLLSGGR